MRLHYLQHVPFEGLGLIADWARERGITLSATRFFDDEPLPHLNELDLLVIMGGPMSVHDTEEYPWLKREMAFISRAIECGKPVLGICLGSQLIATVLGGTVSRNKEREIGWFPIHFSEGATDNPLTPLSRDGEPPTVFHWHGETFSLPEDATLLASNPACAHQAFVTGNRGQVLALQFHLETTAECVRGLIASAEDGELAPDRYVQEPAEMQALAEEHSAYLQPALYKILDQWAGI
jgi:GMP synthase-like glutamine amidotransferase